MLIQSAQHLARHPGPLGHFFKKVKKRKHHNVAVVATARKLAMLAWHILTTHQPYRYAQPNPTEEKLRRLRTKATGQRKKTGPKKGTPNQPLLGAGTRAKRVRSLDDVYANENLPALAPAPAGERRTLEQTGTAKFARSISQTTIVARKSPPRASAADNAQGKPADTKSKNRPLTTKPNQKAKAKKNKRRKTATSTR
jgi:hypothetical protein